MTKCLGYAVAGTALSLNHAIVRVVSRGRGIIIICHTGVLEYFAYVIQYICTLWEFSTRAAGTVPRHVAHVTPDLDFLHCAAYCFLEQRQSVWEEQDDT